MTRAVLFLAGILSFLWGSGLFFLVGTPLTWGGISTREKVVALTFDDGPSQYTGSVLKILQATGTHATFFVLGEEVQRFSSLIKQMVRDGHEVENHSWSHPRLVFHSSRYAAAQIKQTNDLLQSLSGEPPRFFRPPYGQGHLGVYRACHALGLTPVLWSITAYDWLAPGKSRIQSNVLNGLSPGAVILLHDGGGNRRQTVDALEPLIAQTKSLGYRFVILRDLVK